MKRRILALLCVCVCILLPAVWLAWPLGQAPQTVRLKDGFFVTMVSATYGKNHRASAGTIRERLASKLPAKLFPKWPRAFSVQTNTEQDTLVAWIFSTNMAALNSLSSVYTPGVVVDSNGAEFPTTRIVADVRSAGKGRLLGIAVEALPRRDETFLLRLDPSPPIFGTPAIHLKRGVSSPQHADFKLRNPRRSRAEPWGGSPAPLRAVKEDFKCELTRCELDLANRLVFPLKLELDLGNKGSEVTQWQVHWVELEDSTGNFFRENFFGYQPARILGPRFGAEGSAFPRSLLPGAGAWKIRICAIRISGFASNDVWELQNVPLPGRSGFGTQIWRTNLAGVAMEIGSINSLKVPWALSGGAWSSRAIITANDWVILRVRSEDELARTHLVTLADDRGNALGDTRAVNGSWWKGWAREWDAGATSASIRVGVSHPRIVEFLVQPAVIGANP